MHPVLFSVGPIIVYSFSLFLVLGLFLGSFVIWKEGRSGFGENKLFDGILICFLSGLLVARLFFVFFHFDFFSLDVIRWILFVHYPGFSFWGGVVGAFLGLTFFTRSKELFLKLADLYSLGMPLMLIFGDFGCFLNGCVVGKPARLFWAMDYPGVMEGRHPVPLYALLLDFILLLLLFKVFNMVNNKRKELSDERFGLVSLFYFSSFMIARGTLEFYKDKTLYFKGIPVLIPVFVVFGVLGLVIFYKKIGRGFKEDVRGFVALVKRRLSGGVNKAKRIVGVFGFLKNKTKRKVEVISMFNNSLSSDKNEKEQEKND